MHLFCFVFISLIFYTIAATNKLIKAYCVVICLCTTLNKRYIPFGVVPTWN